MAAALELAGEQSPLTAPETAEKDRLLRLFHNDAARSKPISFYTWTPELGRVWRFFRFLQCEFGFADMRIPEALAEVLRSDSDLLESYRAIVAFYGSLTNPMDCLALDQLEPGHPLEALAGKHGVPHETVAVFPPSIVWPRFRVEPLATYYLRTARAYGFLRNFLEATAGTEVLGAMHGLRKDGFREAVLGEELAAIQERSYGFYLVACEDLGMKPEFLPEEPVDPATAQAAALDWLAALEGNIDLAQDTRVSVPVFIADRGATRLWATLGVRLAKLEATYVCPPSLRRPSSGESWEVSYDLAPSHYVIPVDEFAEIELKGSASFTRDEWRALCDKHKTKSAILEALGKL